jgi:Na+-driven multidrug efflux pump
MTEVRTVGRIGLFAAPMVASTILALGAQFGVVGLLGALGGPALYVRSVYGPVSLLFLALAAGLAVAQQVAAARALGGGTPHRVAGLLASTARIGLVCYAVLGVVLLAAMEPLAHLMTVVAADRPLFYRFLVAMVLVLPIGFLGELCAATLRGAGFPTRGLLVTLVSFVMTVGGVAVLGFGAGLGIAAVPIATGVSGLGELALGLWLLRRAGLLSGAGWRRSDREARQLTRGIGIPVAASYLLLFVVDTVFLRIVAAHGQGAVAGFTLGYTLQSAVILPAVGLGAAIAVLINQAIGGGDIPLARLVLRNGVILVAVVYGVLTLALMAFGRAAVEPLSDDPATAHEAVRFMTVVGPAFGATGLILALLTLLEQTGRGLVAVALNIIYFAALSVTGAWYAGVTHSTEGLYRVLAAGAVIGMITGAPIAWVLLRRQIAEAGAAARDRDDEELMMS